MYVPFFKRLHGWEQLLSLHKFTEVLMHITKSFIFLSFTAVFEKEKKKERNKEKYHLGAIT